MHAVELIIHTGARRDEVRRLKWDFVDFGKSILRLPDSKTGPKEIFLTAPAIELLRDLHSQKGDDTVYVFSGGKKGSGLSESTLYKHWKRALKRAQANGLEKKDVRIHDLRHTFASLGVASGLSLQEIRDLLGHTSIATTQRYAHLYDDAKRNAVEKIGAQIASAAE